MTATSPESRYAVFSCLFPDQSGIGAVSSKTFPLHPAFDVFHGLTGDQADAAVNYVQANGGHPSRLKPTDGLGDIENLDAYSALIFVLGNSHHNAFALRHAIQSRHLTVPRAIYLHDGQIDHLLDRMLRRRGALRDEIYARAYPDGRRSGRSIAPLMQLTGITNFIVNSEACAQAILDDIGTFPVRIYRAFLPVHIRAAEPERFVGDWMSIGHFGIPSSRPKRVDALIEAVRLIRRREHATVLLAGWHAADYVSRNVAADDHAFIQVVDDPPEERLLSLMAGVNAAVQLREPHLGETSGVVCQLIGQGVTPIVTAGMTPEELRGRVTEVPCGINPETLAWTIIRHGAERRSTAGLERYSCRSAAERIADIAAGL